MRPTGMPELDFKTVPSELSALRGPSRRSSWVRRVRASSWVAWIISVVAWILIVAVDVESVMCTGALTLLIGIYQIRPRLFREYRPLWALGIAECGVVILFISLVNIFSWSPSDAEVPFTLMGALFVLTTLPLVIHAWKHPPPLQLPWQCSYCGYLLFGLTESRCPECSTPFDPQHLGQHIPDN